MGNISRGFFKSHKKVGFFRENFHNNLAGVDVGYKKMKPKSINRIAPRKM